MQFFDELTCELSMHKKTFKCLLIEIITCLVCGFFYLSASSFFKKKIYDVDILMYKNQKHSINEFLLKCRYSNKKNKSTHTYIQKYKKIKIHLKSHK